MTYGNKNASCKFTDKDIFFGYSAALVSSLGIGLGMRKLTANMMKGATGNKFLAINFLVNASAAGGANFFNTLCMRYPEMDRGIKIYHCENMNCCVGKS